MAVILLLFLLSFSRPLYILYLIQYRIVSYPTFQKQETDDWRKSVVKRHGNGTWRVKKSYGLIQDSLVDISYICVSVSVSVSISISICICVHLSKNTLRSVYGIRVYMCVVRALVFVSVELGKFENCSQVMWSVSGFYFA